MSRKILLHTCCVACLSIVAKKLKEKNFLPLVFYYNPSIHGKSEYQNRLKDVSDFCQKNDLEIIIPDYNSDDFFKPIEPWQNPKSLKFINDQERFRRKRCEFCYDLKIKKTVAEARRRRIKYFSSTLLCSPYQDHEFLDYISSQLARENSLEFVYDDFRKSYWQGRNFARAHKYMIPTYCGCSFSLVEKMLE